MLKSIALIRAISVSTALIMSYGQVKADPIQFNGVMIDNLSSDYTYYSSGNPNVGATRNKNRTNNLTITFQVFEKGSLLTTSTFLTRSCTIDGVIQSPSFAYKVDGKQNESFNCKIKDESQRGGFTTKVSGSATFKSGVLQLSGTVTQRGKYTLNSAPDRTTTYLAANDQKLVVAIKDKKCTLKSFSLTSRRTESSPETSRHYGGRNEETVTYRVTPKSSCKLY